MASRNRTRTVAPVAEIATETPTNVYTAEQGGSAIAAAWRGLYWLLGARHERIEVTREGINIHGLTFDEKYDAETIINDVVRRGDKIVNPRLNFLDIYPFVNGETPAPFTNADQITAWMVRFIKGGSRSPKYIKDANQDYKVAHGIAVHRGRPKKVVRITEIGQLDATALREVPKAERDALLATIESMNDTSVEA